MSYISDYEYSEQSWHSRMPSSYYPRCARSYDDIGFIKKVMCRNGEMGPSNLRL